MDQLQTPHRRFWSAHSSHVLIKPYTLSPRVSLSREKKFPQVATQDTAAQKTRGYNTSQRIICQYRAWIHKIHRLPTTKRRLPHGTDEFSKKEITVDELITDKTSQTLTIVSCLFHEISYFTLSFFKEARTVLKSWILIKLVPCVYFALIQTWTLPFANEAQQKPKCCTVVPKNFST